MTLEPKFPAHETIYKRMFLLEALPKPLTRADEHWQIFDDYTAWPEFRLRKIRVPETREWFAAEETVSIAKAGNGWKEDISRTILPAEEIDGLGAHPDKEIRKNRYFFEELVIDVFLGELWGLILAQASFEDEEKMLRFDQPHFVLAEVSQNEFFRSENLVKMNFLQVSEEYDRLKVVGS